MAYPIQNEDITRQRPLVFSIPCRKRLHFSPFPFWPDRVRNEAVQRCKALVIKCLNALSDLYISNITKLAWKLHI